MTSDCIPHQVRRLGPTALARSAQGIAHCRTAGRGRLHPTGHPLGYRQPGRDSHRLVQQDAARAAWRGRGHRHHRRRSTRRHARARKHATVGVRLDGSLRTRAQPTLTDVITLRCGADMCVTMSGDRRSRLHTRTRHRPGPVTTLKRSAPRVGREAPTFLAFVDT